MKNFPNIQQGIDSKSCGPNCLLNIYEYFGIQKRLSEILADLRITAKDPTYISQLARHLHSNKLTTEFITSNPNSVVASWANEPKEKIIEKLKEWVTHNSKDLWLMENIHILFYLQ